MSFAGKVVIVTGASSGIGAATAVMFCREGASVALVGRNQAKLQDVSQQCTKAGGKHIVLKADVANDDDAKRIVADTITAFEKLDILVNNAGVGKFGTILGGDFMDSYDGLININLRAVMHLTCLAAPHLVKTIGNIVNISGVAGCRVIGGSFGTDKNAYSVSKAAVIHFTKGAAMELAEHGVRVNVISPGPVITDIMENSGLDASWEHIMNWTALKRASDADEIADLVLYLASDKARGITGSNVVTDNGSLLK